MAHKKPAHKMKWASAHLDGALASLHGAAEPLLSWALGTHAEIQLRGRSPLGLIQPPTAR